METRWYHYIFAFIAGGIFVNFLPHFINGISGRPFPSPFSDPPGIGLSSPIDNITWATINLAVVLAFVFFGGVYRCKNTVHLASLAGGLAMGFYLAHYFGGLGLA